MTELQTQLIQALIEASNPFSKAVYESFLNTNRSQEQTQAPVLLDIIRSHFVILNQQVILKNPIKWAVEAYINVYNILFPGEFKLVRYVPTFFNKEELDEEDNELFFNETICLGYDGLYYLCDTRLEPKDKGYATEENLITVHGSLGICL